MFTFVVCILLFFFFVVMFIFVASSFFLLFLVLVVIIVVQPSLSAAFTHVLLVSGVLISGAHHAHWFLYVLFISDTKGSLLVSNRYYIRNISLDGDSVVLLAQRLNNAVALDFDWKERKIYWSDVTSNGSFISRMDDTGENKQVTYIPLGVVCEGSVHLA